MAILLLVISKASLHSKWVRKFISNIHLRLSTIRFLRFINNILCAIHLYLWILIYNLTLIRLRFYGHYIHQHFLNAPLLPTFMVKLDCLLAETLIFLFHHTFVDFHHTKQTHTHKHTKTKTHTHKHTYQNKDTRIHVKTLNTKLRLILP